MGNEEQILKVKAAVNEAIREINSNSQGADLKEAKKYLADSAQALKNNSFDNAVKLAKKAEIYAIISKANLFDIKALKAFESQQYDYAIDLWNQALQMYALSKHKEVIGIGENITKKLDDATTKIEMNISNAKKAVEELKKKLETEDQIRRLKITVEESISHSTELLQNAKMNDLIIDESYLNKAKDSFRTEDYTQAVSFCRQFDTTVTSLIQEKEKEAENKIKNSEELLRKSQSAGLNLDKTYLNEAKDTFAKLNYSKSISYCEQFDAYSNQKIEKIEKEAKEKIENSDALLKKSKVYGLHFDTRSLDLAKKALSNSQFIKSIEYCEQFDQAINSLINTKEKEAKEKIKESQKLFEKTKGYGFHVDDTYLNNAINHLRNLNYAQTIQSCENSDKLVNKLIYDKKIEAEDKIKGSNELLEKAVYYGIKVDQKYFTQAKQAFDKSDYLQALQYCGHFDRTVNQLILDKKKKTENQIRKSEELFNRAKSYALDPEEKYIKLSKNLFENAEYVKCLEQCDISNDLLQKMIQEKENKTKDILNNSEQLLEKAKGYKLNPNKALLEQAQIAFKKSDYLATIKHCDEFDKSIHTLIQDKERETSGILKKSVEFLEKAKGYGLTPDETYLKQAKDAFANLDYLKAIQYSEQFENTLKQKILETEKEAKKALEQSGELIEKTRAQGITPDEKYFKEANDFFSRPDYAKTIQLCQQSDSHVNQLVQEKQTEAQGKLNISEQLLEKAQKLSLDPGMHVFESIQESYSQSIFGRTIEIADAFIKSTQGLIKEGVPVIVSTIPTVSFKIDNGKKVNMLLKNEGKVTAENIILEMKGEAELRLPSKVPNIDPGEQLELPIWIRPNLEGDIPLDIILSFKDGLEREYEIKNEIYIDVKDKFFRNVNNESESFEEKTRASDFHLTPKSSTALPEEIANLYSDAKFIGKGGFARVFRATNKKGDVVALKLPLNLDPATGKSFLKEIDVWRQLKHDNIIKIYDLNILPFLYIEMEYAEKGSLNEFRKTMEVETASKIIFDISEGLKHAHEKGIIHRDLKPHNILLTAEISPKITDWGLSKVMTQSTSSHNAGYTPIYASPEQISPKKFGSPDIRTDVYQLGVIFYELVAGKLPFEGDDFNEIGSAILFEKPDIPSSCNPSCSDLDNIIMKCLEKKPADRYQNMQEFQADLASYLKMEYSKSLKMSVGDLRRSCIYCGDLFLINAKIGDTEGALQYALDMRNYASGNYREDFEDIITRLDYVVERKMAIGEELMSKIKILMHQVKMGR